MNNRKKIILTISLIIFAGIITLLIFMIRSENDSYTANGISVQAKILEKRKIDDNRSSKNKQMRYVFRISYFTNPENNTTLKKPAQDTLQQDKSNIENTIDDIFGDTNRDKLGDYTSTELNVPAEVYHKYLVGDKIQIIYLPDKHEKVRLDLK